MPIDWPKPFDLVMIQAMGLRHAGDRLRPRPGRKPEIIDDGVTGFIVHDQEQAISAAQVGIDRIDRRRCRGVFEQRFAASVMARRYLDVYRQVIDGGFRLGRRGQESLRLHACSRGAASAPVADCKRSHACFDAAFDSQRPSSARWIAQAGCAARAGLDHGFFEFGGGNRFALAVLAMGVELVTQVREPGCLGLLGQVTLSLQGFGMSASIRTGSGTPGSRCSIGTPAA